MHDIAVKAFKKSKRLLQLNVNVRFKSAVYHTPAGEGRGYHMHLLPCPRGYHILFGPRSRDYHSVAWPWGGDITRGGAMRAGISLYVQFER